MRKYDPIDLASSDKKSSIYFRNLRWNGKRICPRCRYRFLYYLKSNRYGCKRCRYNFSEFTGTYLGQTRTSLSNIIHLLYLFTLGVPAYRIRFYVSCDLSTIERTFRLFRQTIYDKSLQQLHELKLSVVRLKLMKRYLVVIEKVAREDGVQLSTKIWYLVSTREMELLLHFQYLIENMRHLFP